MDMDDFSDELKQKFTDGLTALRKRFENIKTNAKRWHKDKSQPSYVANYADTLVGDMMFFRDRARARMLGRELFKQTPRAKPVPGGKGPVKRDYTWGFQDELHANTNKYLDENGYTEDEYNIPNYGKDILHIDPDKGTIESLEPPVGTLDKMPNWDKVRPDKRNLGNLMM